MRIAVALWLTLLVAGRPWAADDVPDCRFGPGALPAETLDPKSPHGSAIPIDHIVVLMQENRSYDHYFGKLRRKSGPPKNASNPDPTGGAPIKPFHQTRYCEVADLEHAGTGSHADSNGGAMDGFTAANADAADGDPTGSRAMGYYTKDDLPFYYKLYKTFASSDQFFCGVLGPTFPNRYYLL